MMRAGALFAAANAITAAVVLAMHEAPLTAAAGGFGPGATSLLAGWGALLSLGVSAALLLVAWPIAAWRARAGAAVLVLGQAVFLVLLAIDARTYGLLGVHLHSPVVLDALSNPSVAEELQLSAATLASMFAALALAIAAESALVALCRSALVRRVRWAVGALGLIAVGAPAALLALPAGAEAELDALPGYALLAGQRAPAPVVSEVVYPAPGTELPHMERRPDILFITVESLRADALGATLMPRLHRFAAEHRCTGSARHYAGGHTTELGIFSLLYGLETHRYAPFAERRIPSFPLEILAKNGYLRVGASASALQDWNNAGFIVDQLDRYEELVTDGSWQGDLDVLALATEVARAPRTQPLFLFLFFDSTHHNYQYPPAFERYLPVVEPGYDHFMGDDALREHERGIINRYRNAVTFVDATIGGVLDAFEERLLRGELVVVVTGDHGEEFWEHGLLGHGASRFQEERVRVPLVMCLPGASPEPAALSYHADIWPTVLSALGLGGESAWSDGASLLSPPEDRALLLGGTTFPFGNKDACLVEPGRKTWLELAPGDGLSVRTRRVTDLDDVPLPGLSPQRPPLGERVRARVERFVKLGR